MATINTRTTECPACYQPNASGSRCVPVKGCSTTSAQQIAAGFAVLNDPNQVRQILVNNKIVSTIEAANNLSDKQLVSTLVGYANTNGNGAYANLLRQFLPNPNANNITTNQAASTALLNDLAKTVPEVAAQVNARNAQQAAAAAGQPVTLDACNWLCQTWNGLVGSQTSTTPPTVTTTSSVSPTVIFMIIGEVAILGIIAWIAVKGNMERRTKGWLLGGLFVLAALLGFAIYKAPKTTTTTTTGGGTSVKTNGIGSLVSTIGAFFGF